MDQLTGTLVNPINLYWMAGIVLIIAAIIAYLIIKYGPAPAE